MSTTYHRRADPREPFRYECPHCGSVDIRANANNGKPGSTTEHDHQCNACYRAFDEPIDRKEADQ